MGNLKFLLNDFKEIKKKILKQEFGQKVVFNFLNSNDVYAFKNNKGFRKILLDKEMSQNNYIDGFVNSLILSIKNLKIVSRLRGPNFTKKFLLDRELNKDKKHLFIGLEKEDKNKLAEKSQIKEKNIFSYNPPFIKGVKFSKGVINKITKLTKKCKPHYIWICIGCPKQNILTRDIYREAKFNYIFNVGAALDFFLGKKEEAPLFVQEIGIEWLYRLITDFSYSKKKVWRSLIGFFYGIKDIKLNS